MNTWYSMEQFAYDKHEQRLREAESGSKVKHTNIPRRWPPPRVAWIGRLIEGAQRMLTRLPRVGL